MANDSSTGGPLLPAPTPPNPAPLEGQQLSRFIQQWLSATSGLAGELFFPRWQPDPPNIPPAATAWASFGIQSRPSDVYPYVAHVSVPATDTKPAQQYDQLFRNEDLHLLVSFYDLGTNGQADFYAAQLRDGTAIAQNSEILGLNKFEFIECGELAAVPVLLKERWLYRVDMPLHLRRAIIRVYPVLDVESGLIMIVAQDPVGGEITVEVTAPPA